MANFSTHQKSSGTMMAISFSQPPKHNTVCFGFIIHLATASKLFVYRFPKFSTIYGCALQVASNGGHEAVFQLLLQKYADVNAQGGCYGFSRHRLVVT